MTKRTLILLLLSLSSPVSVHCSGGGGASQTGSVNPNATEAMGVVDVAKATAYYRSHLRTLVCDPPEIKYPRWEGYPVQRCIYEDVGIKTRTYMLNPSAEQLARWTVTACSDAAAVSQERCISHMANLIMRESSGIFPIDGYIPEPGSSVRASDNGPRCPLFRDGVTIATESWDTNRAIGKGCGPEDEIKKAAVRAKKYARVASTTREDYRAAGGSKDVGKDCVSAKKWQKRANMGEVGTNCDVRWLDVVRESYQRAWDSDRNDLISAKAKAEKARGAFK